MTPEARACSWVSLDFETYASNRLSQVREMPTVLRIEGANSRPRKEAGAFFAGVRGWKVRSIVVPVTRSRGLNTLVSAWTALWASLLAIRARCSTVINVSPRRTVMRRVMGCGLDSWGRSGTVRASAIDMGSNAASWSMAAMSGPCGPGASQGPIQTANSQVRAPMQAAAVRPGRGT